MIQDQVKKVLKELGFRKRGRTFHRRAGDMWQSIDFQTTWMTAPEEARFAVNLNVILPFYHEKWTGQPVPRNLASSAAISSVRLSERSLEGLDRWWTVTPASDIGSISQEVADLLVQLGLPDLERATDIQFLVERLSSEKRFPGMRMSEELALAILLTYLDRENEAVKVIERLRSSNRLPHFSKTIDLIESRLSLADYG